MEDNSEKALIDINFQSGSETIGNSEVELSWQDVDFIISNGIVLRHVSDEKTARINAESGFNGDALALFNIGEFFLEQNIKELKGKNSNIKRFSDLAEDHGMDVPIGLVKEYLDTESKEKIIALMHGKLVDFVRDSLNIGAAGLIYRGFSVDDAKNVLRTRSSFLLVQLNNPFAFDQGRYYGLGKVGKQEVSPKRVIGSVYANEVIDGLKLNNVSSDGIVDDTFFNKLEEAYYQNIVQSVKNLTTMESIS